MFIFIIVSFNIFDIAVFSIPGELYLTCLLILRELLLYLYVVLFFPIPLKVRPSTLFLSQWSRKILSSPDPTGIPKWPGLLIRAFVIVPNPRTQYFYLLQHAMHSLFITICSKSYFFLQNRICVSPFHFMVPVNCLWETNTLLMFEVLMSLLSSLQSLPLVCTSVYDYYFLD